MSESLQVHRLQHARLPCPSPTPGACSNSCPLSRWCCPNHLIHCHPLLLPWIFPSIQVFSKETVLHIRWPKYWSFSFSISPPSEYSGLISFRIDWLGLLAPKGLSRVFSNTTVEKHQFFGAQLYSHSNSHIHTWLLEKKALTRRTFVCKVMSMLLNMLSRLVITFLPWRKHLLISWLQ